MMRFLFSLISLLFLLAACNTQQLDTNYYLSLTGESETWELTGYEIMLTSDGMKAGHGKLIMKDEGKYNTDSFSFDAYVVMDGEEDRVHGGSVAGQTDISEQTTGAIESGYSMEFNDVSEIYMIVKWWDPDKNEDVGERIDLYNKSKNEETFLN